MQCLSSGRGREELLFQEQDHAVETAAASRENDNANVLSESAAHEGDSAAACQRICGANNNSNNNHLERI